MRSTRSPARFSSRPFHVDGHALSVQLRLPQTLSEDGDPADVLFTPFLIQIGAVVFRRAIMLEMDDESGGDAAGSWRCPSRSCTPVPQHQVVRGPPAEDVSRIQHFFEHYKDLERASGSRSRVGRAWTPRTRKSCAAPSATPRARPEIDCRLGRPAAEATAGNRSHPRRFASCAGRRAAWPEAYKLAH